MALANKIAARALTGTQRKMGAAMGVPSQYAGLVGMGMSGFAGGAVGAAAGGMATGDGTGVAGGAMLGFAAGGLGGAGAIMRMAHKNKPLASKAIMREKVAAGKIRAGHRADVAAGRGPVQEALGAMGSVAPSTSGTLVASNSTKGGGMGGWVGKAKSFAASAGGRSLAANAGYGAAAGAITGGLNPMGNDGMIGGAMSGAMIGGLAGAVSGGALRANRGGTMIGKKGGMRMGISESGRMRFNTGKTGYNLPGRASMYAGAAGGLIGGSGNSKRHTTIGTNGWSQGTHPAYFGGY